MTNLNVNLSYMYKNLISTIIVLWSIYVTYQWIASHDYFLHIILQFKTFGAFVALHHTFPFWIALSIALCAFMITLFRKHPYRISLNISPFTIGLSLYLFIIILYAFSLYIRVEIPQMTPIFTGENLFIQMFDFIKISSAQIIWLILFTYIVYVCGYTISKIPFINHVLQDLPTKLLHNLFIIGNGIIAFSAIAFLLATFSLLNIWSITLIMLCIAIINMRLFISILHNIFRQKNIHLSSLTLTPWIIFAIVTFFSIVFIDSLYPNPHGFDAATEYLNRAKDIAISHGLISGGYPFTYSLFMSIPYLFSRNGFFVFGTNMVFAVLALISLYEVLRTWTHNKKNALLLTTLWLTLPLTATYLHFEAKAELMLFFISTLCVILIKRILDKPKSVHLYYYLALLCGYVISIKVVAVIFVISISLPLLYVFLKTRHTWIQKTKTLLIAITLCIAPLVPWSLYALYTNDTPYHIKEVLVSHNNTSATLPPPFSSQNDMSCKDTAIKDDFNRYALDISHPLLSPISIPWALMINDTSIRPKTMLEIGYVFMMFYGILIVGGIILCIRKTHLKQKNVWPLVSITMTYWLLWAIFCKNVIWYAYPGFILLLIIISIVLKELLHKKYIAVYIMLISLIFLSIIINILSRSKTYLPPETISYIHFRKSSTIAPAIIAKLNHPENLKKKIYMPQMPIIYHINNQHQRIVTDHVISNYDCIMNATGDDFDFMLDYLKNNNISYVLHSFSGEISASDIAHRPNIANKMSSFKAFSENKLILLEQQSGMILYAVPQ